MKLGIEFNKQKSEEVESFISQFGRVFHAYDYINCLGEDYHCILIRNSKDNQIDALYPFVLSKKHLFKSLHIPPYTHLNGPIVNPNSRNDTRKVLTELLEALPAYHHVDFKVHLATNDIIPFSSAGYKISPRQSHIVKSSTTYNETNQIIHSSKRRYLKKLLNELANGELVIVEGENCHNDLISLQQETAVRNKFAGKTSILKRLLSNHKKFGNYSFVIYSKDGNPLSGAFCPYDNFSAYHLINASLKSSNSFFNKINILSTYLAVKKAMDKKLCFDFEGSQIPGIANFYYQMGGQPILNYRMQKTKFLPYKLIKSIEHFLDQ